MTQVVDSSASIVEQLNRRVQELERRVSALENQPQPTPTAKPVARDAVVAVSTERTRPPATWRGFPPPQTTGGTIPTLGKAVLAIAGAYLLRAIFESGSVPQLPVLLVAIVYACLWMFWAIRLHATNDFASVTYGVTSALILSPLLWESTVRFHVVPPAFTGIVLVAYVALMLLLTWRLDLQLISWLTVLASVNTALALIVATHALVPLITVLLTIVLLLEIAACLRHPLSFRVVPAIAADLALLLLIDVMTSADGVPDGYQPATAFTIASLCLAPLFIIGGSIAVRAFKARKSMTVFDLFQGVLAFVIAVFGALRATHASAAPVLGILFLLLAAACYWGTFFRFALDPDALNRTVCAVWSSALLTAGAILLFPTGPRVAFFSLAAIGCAFAFTRLPNITLAIHSSVYLAAAALASPLPDFELKALAGSLPSAPHWTIWLVVASAAFCYWLGSREPQTRLSRRALWLLPALLVSFAGSALVIGAIAHYSGSLVQSSASRISVIRTLVNCGLALALAFIAFRWKRVELGWIAYAAVAFGTLKLLFEDLRFGNAASLVFSLLFYGLILILLPRFLQRGRLEAS